MLKFSNANAKIQALKQVPELAHYLRGKRKVYSFDMLSGHTCPFADQCLRASILALAFENFNMLVSPKKWWLIY